MSNGILIDSELKEDPEGRPQHIAELMAGEAYSNPRHPDHSRVFNTVTSYFKSAYSGRKCGGRWTNLTNQ